MSKKSGANREDIIRIRELASEGALAQYISDLLQIALDTVISFMGLPRQLDLDGDGKPDEALLNVGGVHVTHDADSVNIDIDGDGKADIIIPHN
jgi:hypothetical protein